MHTVLVAIYIIILYTSTNTTYTHTNHTCHTQVHTHNTHIGLKEYRHGRFHPSLMEGKDSPHCSPSQMGRLLSHACTDLHTPTHTPYTDTHTHTYTHTHTHSRYRGTHIAKVEHKVELADVAEELIQYLHKVVDGLEIAKIVVLEVQTEAEVQTSVSLGGNLEATEKERISGLRKEWGLSSPYVCTSSLDT